MNLQISDYRFNIRERMNNLSPEQKENLLNTIERATKVSRTTLKRIMYLRKEDDFKADWQVIASFAIAFNVTPDQLDNLYPVLVKFVNDEY
jgi:purine nucleoside permease